MKPTIFCLIMTSIALVSSCKSTGKASSRNPKAELQLKDCDDKISDCSESQIGSVKTEPSEEPVVDPAKTASDSPDPVIASKGEDEPTPTPVPSPTPIVAPPPEVVPPPVPTLPTPDPSMPAPIPTPLPAPLKCTAETIHYVSGPGQCGPNAAAFAVDDNKTFVLACCPLPASDILLPVPATPRGGECASQEIAVGVTQAANGLLCAPINTSFYTLAAPTPSCYLGSGASGGAGAKKCGIPLEIEKALIKPFGSDSCLTSPYGGLVTKRKSKYCRDVSGALLLYKSSNAPVPMFQ